MAESLHIQTVAVFSGALQHKTRLNSKHGDSGFPAEKTQLWWPHSLVEEAEAHILQMHTQNCYFLDL